MRASAHDVLSIAESHCGVDDTSVLALARQGESWHPQQVGQFLTDGRYELRIPYGDERDLVMDIMWHAADMEIVALAALRAEIAKRLRASLAYYEK